MGKISYQVQVPSKLKFDRVSHVSILKPYHEDKDDLSRNKSNRTLIVVNSFNKYVEYTFLDKIIQRRRVLNYIEYLVRLKNL